MASLLMIAYIFLQFIQTRVVGGSDHLIAKGSTLIAGAQSPDAWYSTSNLFAFGFYPQDTGYVVAIWLVITDETTVVWTAFRDAPPVPPNATLELTHKGELVLVSGRSGVHNTIAANVHSALMKDDGNFILYNDSMGVVWQSFDHPTDSLLQHQSLYGGMELVSSVSNKNYSSGRFRIKMQMDGNLCMYPIITADIGVNAYWCTETSGRDASKIYLYLNDTGLMLINGNNSDTIKNLYNNSDTIKNLYTDPPYPVIYRATLGDDGIFQLYSYNSTNSPSSVVWKTTEHPCDVKNFCGFNSYCTMNDEQPYCVCLPGSDFIDPDREYIGCERNFTKAWCNSGKENMTYYSMVAKKQLGWTDHPYYQAITDSKEDCSKSCLEDCDCDASVLKDGYYCEKHKYPLRYVKRDYDDTTSTCFFKTGTISFNSQENATSTKLPERVETVVTTSRKTWVVVLVLSIGFSIYSCISLGLSGFFIFKYRLLKYKRLLETRTLGLAEELILRSYTYNELRRATSGFSRGVTHLGD